MDRDRAHLLDILEAAKLAICKMAGLTYDPVPHNPKAFLEKASKRRGFREAYDALEIEYALVHEMLSARTRAGLTQAAAADRMGKKMPRFAT